MEIVEVVALAGGATVESAYGAFCLTLSGLTMEYDGQNYPCSAVLPIQNQAYLRISKDLAARGIFTLNSLTRMEIDGHWQGTFCGQMSLIFTKTVHITNNVGTHNCTI